MAANGNDNIRRIIRGIYTGDEIPVILRREVVGIHFLGVYGEETVEDEVILPDVTHLEVDPNITAIPVAEYKFYGHPNLVELICHENVKKIEAPSDSDVGTLGDFHFPTFYGCPNLRRVVLRGVEEVEGGAFNNCHALKYVKCNKLAIIGEVAFCCCESLRDIDLPSARIVGRGAFTSCKDMEGVTFGKDLESIESRAFRNCSSLERITIPLKNGLFYYDDTFQDCEKLMRVHLVEGEVLNDTVNALFLEEWRNEMRTVIDSINHDLPDAPAGYYSGEKTMVIREWISSVLNKIIDYKAQHRRLLNEVVTPTLENVLPNDIVLDSVLPFLELPPYTFDGEEDEGVE